LPASYIINRMIKEELGKILNPIQLKVFIDKYDQLITEKTLSILNNFKEKSNGNLNYETFSINENNEMNQKYQVKRSPTILFINNEGNEVIRYLSAPEGSEVKPFIEALQILSGKKNYYKKTINENLDKIKASTIKVMVSKTCAYCHELVNTISQFALGSSGKIKAEIIDIGENPDIGNNYDIETVPYTIINNQTPILGLISPFELLQQLLNESQ
jgi:alkyl hydroperoxide reductase subunit AhpF